MCKTMKLPVSCTIKAFDDELLQLSSEDFSSDLTLDMTATGFIEVSCMLHLISFLTQRVKIGYKTSIKLPRSRKVRDFLRVWRFDAALQRSTDGMRLSHLCRDEESKTYFGEGSQYYQKARTTVESQLLRTRFFSITAMDIRTFDSEQDKNHNMRLVEDEASRWKENLIQTFLSLNLDKNKPASYLPSNIIYEAMTNSVRHPKADLLLATSFSDDTYGGENNEKRLLTISFWDNGASIYKTLNDAMDRSNDVRSAVTPEEHITYDVDYVIKSSTSPENERSPFSENNRPQYELVSSDSDLALIRHEHQYFMACLFPGVSSDLQRKKDIPRPEEFTTRPGWGLQVLLNTVCEIFDGTIVFRTGNILAEINRNEDDTNASYKVCITIYYGIPRFLGNLTTVRLPLEGVK